MQIQLHHCFALVDTCFEKYGLYPLTESEENVVRDAFSAALNSGEEDLDAELFMSTLDAAFAVRGIIPSDLIQHGEQRW